MVKKITIMMVALLLPVIALSTKALAWNYSSDPALYQGMQGADVTQLQTDLKTLGYFDYSVTGYFGSHTRDSVVHFQGDHRLAPDGVVGANTGREIKAAEVLQKAKQYIGVPYAWGGTTPSGFDCSGFTQYVFRQNGVDIPRTSDQQYEIGSWVSRDQLKAGDLVFFSTYKAGPSHVGIYMGNNQFIQASSSQGITITDMSNPYFAPRYLGAKRVLL